MKIEFNISDEEMNIIAEQYSFDPTKATSMEDFVIGVFKQFGRDCIVSKAVSDSVINMKDLKEAAAQSASGKLTF